MKRLLLLTVLLTAGATAVLAQAPAPTPPTTLRGVLLEQLKTSHTDEDWYVPAKIAVDGLTAEQAMWSPGAGNHSVGQLAYHLWYWDRRALQRFNGEKQEPFDGNNNETFDKFSAAQWDELVKNLDQVMTDWEKAVEDADEATLEKNASLIAHVGAHNAYHIGQILYVRKLHGVWNPDKGVK